MNREMRRNPILFPFVGLLVLLTTLLRPTVVAHAAYDSIGMLRKVSDGNLTATANLPANPGLLVDSTGIASVAFIRISVPQATGTSPTADIVVQDSPDGTTWSDRVTFAQITAAGTYRQAIATKQKYLRVKQTVAGTTPNFGAVQVGIDTGSEYRG